MPGRGRPATAAAVSLCPQRHPIVFPCCQANAAASNIALQASPAPPPAPCCREPAAALMRTLSQGLLPNGPAARARLGGHLPAGIQDDQLAPSFFRFGAEPIQERNRGTPESSHDCSRRD